MKQNIVLENIHSRKSVRKFTGQKVSHEDLLSLVRAGMAAPSGKNVRPWHFVVIENPEVLTGIAEKLPYAKMLPAAGAAIAVCGDIEKSMYWYVDCAAATQNILLAAEAMGFGAVWTAVYPYDERISVAQESLNLPKNIVPLSIVPVGYPTGVEKPRSKWDENKVRLI
jgi:nitroreductase